MAPLFVVKLCIAANFDGTISQEEECSILDL